MLVVKEDAFSLITIYLGLLILCVGLVMQGWSCQLTEEQFIAVKELVGFI